MQLDDLNALAEKHRASRKTMCLRTCMSAGCMSSQADVIKKNLEAEVNAQGLEADVEMRRVGCMGFCGQGPLVGVDGTKPEGELLEHVTPADANHRVRHGLESRAGRGACSRDRQGQEGRQEGEGGGQAVVVVYVRARPDPPRPGLFCLRISRVGWSRASGSSGS